MTKDNIKMNQLYKIMKMNNTKEFLANVEIDIIIK